jgi:hypothetical protein
MQSWLRGNIFLIVLLSVYRIFFLISIKSELSFSSEMQEIIFAFLVGLRFDLMVLGFINIPIVFFTKTEKAVKLFPYYFIACAGIVSVMSSLDAIYFQINNDRVNKLFLFPTLEAEQIIKIILFSIPFAVFTFLYLSQKEQKIILTNWKTYLAAIFLVALATRGSLGQHHLDLRHSEISKNNFINLLCINSPYAWDQALRGRR